MRTTQRDQGGTTTFAASVIDAASGSGVAQPGAVPFTFTRTGAGSYTVNFDTRLTPVAPVVVPADKAVSRCSGGAPGTFNVFVESPPGTFVNGSWRFSCTALDKRT
jgi:hypothetical protein